MLLDRESEINSSFGGCVLQWVLWENGGRDGECFPSNKVEKIFFLKFWLQFPIKLGACPMGEDMFFFLPSKGFQRNQVGTHSTSLSSLQIFSKIIWLWNFLNSLSKHQWVLLERFVQISFCRIYPLSIWASLCIPASIFVFPVPIWWLEEEHVPLPTWPQPPLVASFLWVNWGTFSNLPALSFLFRSSGVIISTSLWTQSDQHSVMSALNSPMGWGMGFLL